MSFDSIFHSNDINVIKEKYNYNFIFRGVGSSSYKLIPSYFRMNNIDKMYIKELWPIIDKDYSVNEIDYKKSDLLREKLLIKFFYDRANEEGLHLPQVSTPWLANTLGSMSTSSSLNVDNFQVKDVLEVTALAQHYGVKTRLIDFTRDWIVALYFAVRDAINIIDMVDHEKYDELKQSGIGDDIINKIKTGGMSQCYFSVWGLNISVTEHVYPGLQLITPSYYDNTNIKAQRGLLLSIPTRNDDYEKYVPLEDRIKNLYDERKGKEELKAPSLVKVDIPYSNLNKMIKILKDNNKLHHDIFPGYSSIGSCFYEYLNWKRVLDKHNII